MEKVPKKNIPQEEKVDEPSDKWKIDKYQIIEILGKGSFSKVYKARHALTKEEFAIKMINEERILKENELQTQQQDSAGFASLEDMYLSIRDEAAVLKTLEHPNILKFYGISEKGVYKKRDGKPQISTLYSISEVCPNGDLWEYIEYGGKFKDKYCRYLFLQILDALEYMHGKGFAHRDIKPANMLLDKDFNLKLNDFGFATCFKGKNKNGKLLTILGTPEYEAPELIKEKEYYGQAVDVFAAGVVLFNMFTGKPAFKCADSSKPTENPFYFMLSRRNNNYWKDFSQKYWSIKDPDAMNLFPKDFKTQIFGMLAENPEARWTIQQIRENRWMKEEVATKEEMIEEFKRRFGPMKYQKATQKKKRDHTFAFKKKFNNNLVKEKAHFKK